MTFDYNCIFFFLLPFLFGLCRGTESRLPGWIDDDILLEEPPVCANELGATKFTYCIGGGGGVACAEFVGGICDVNGGGCWNDDSASK